MMIAAWAGLRAKHAPGEGCVGLKSVRRKGVRRLGRLHPPAGVGEILGTRDPGLLRTPLPASTPPACPGPLLGRIRGGDVLSAIGSGFGMATGRSPDGSLAVSMPLNVEEWLARGRGDAEKRALPLPASSHRAVSPPRVPRTQNPLFPSASLPLCARS